MRPGYPVFFFLFNSFYIICIYIYILYYSHICNIVKIVNKSAYAIPIYFANPTTIQSKNRKTLVNYLLHSNHSLHNCCSHTTKEAHNYAYRQNTPDLSGLAGGGRSLAYYLQWAQSRTRYQTIPTRTVYRATQVLYTKMISIWT